MTSIRCWSSKAPNSWRLKRRPDAAGALPPRQEDVGSAAD
jgi:hypothetical protein